MRLFDWVQYISGRRCWRFGLGQVDIVRLHGILDGSCMIYVVQLADGIMHLTDYYSHVQHMAMPVCCIGGVAYNTCLATVKKREGIHSRFPLNPPT
jgi:hypothetical protein